MFKKIGSAYDGLKVFFDEVSFEMGKVTWPSRDEVINSTVLVGVATVILTFTVMIVDLIIGMCMAALIRLFS